MILKSKGFQIMLMIAAVTSQVNFPCLGWIKYFYSILLFCEPLEEKEMSTLTLSCLFGRSV